MKKISVIIPTYNEQDFIKKTLNSLQSFAKTEIEVIVVDGSSVDQTVEIVQESGVNCIHVKKKNRAYQMNIGAQASSGDILYFLHADTVPPNHYDKLILQSIDNGNSAGCFRLNFDSSHWFLSALSFFTRFRTLWFRYGDQSLYIERSAFEAIKGFQENMNIMEDQDIIKRIRELYRFDIIKHPVTTSARRFKDNGVYRLFFIYFRLFVLSKFGLDQKRLATIYRSKINSGKV